MGYGDGLWWRGYGSIMLDNGAITLATGAFDVTNEVEYPADVIGAGNETLAIAGAFSMGEEDGDPMNGWYVADAYSCGWSKGSLPAYDGDYAIVENAVLPDGLFKDACGDIVRLHDLAGSYLVVTWDALDCPACKTMASEEEQFLADMTTDGYQVSHVTLMDRSLSDSSTEVSQPLLANWATKYGLTTPVLADRHWGESVFYPFSTDWTLSYPSWIVARPDLTVVVYGFGSDWPGIRAAIEADAM